MELKSAKIGLVTLGATLSFNSFAELQNEVSLGIMDIRDQNDQFIGVEYKRYLEPVVDDNGPLLISPYLQRVNDVSVRYFQLDRVRLYQLGGSWYFDPRWVVSGDYQFIDRKDYGTVYSNDHYHAVDLNLGYFLRPHWQAGIGVLYQTRSEDYDFGDESGTFSKTEWSPSVFTRYTQLNKGKGWDLQGEWTFSDRQTLELDARYFFSQQFSTSATYTFIEDDSEFVSEHDSLAGQHLLELGLDYWFSRHFNVKFGLGTDLEEGDGLSSLTLATSLRF